jgi:hypothetical protein
MLPTGLQIHNHFNLQFQFPLLIVVLIPFYTNDTTITLLPLLSHPLDDDLIVASASAVSWQWIRR